MVPCEPMAPFRSCDLARSVPCEPHRGVSRGRPWWPVPHSCPKCSFLSVNPACRESLSCKAVVSHAAELLAEDQTSEKDTVQTDSSSEKEKENPITGSKSVSQNVALSLIMILLLPKMCFFFSCEYQDVLES